MLKELFQRFKWLILLASVLSTVSALAGVGMLAMITDAMGQLGKGNAGPAYPFVLFIGATILVMALGFLSQYLLIRLSAAVVYEIRKTLLQRVLATSYERVERIGGHRVMAAMKSDVATLSSGLLLAPTFIYNAVTVLLCLGYMLYSSWQLFLFVVIVIVLMVVMIKVILSNALVHQNALREYEDSLFSNLRALTNGGKEIHLSLNRRRHFYRSVMLPLFENIRQGTVKAESLFNVLRTYTGTLIFFLIGSVVYGAHIFLPEIKTQVVVAFVLIILYIIEPLSGLVDVADQANAARVSLKKLGRLDLAEVTAFSLPDSRQEEGSEKLKRLSVEGLCYRYSTTEQGDEIAAVVNDERRFAIGPVSVEFKAGEATFLVGGNGSGKSTFAKVLTGLYPAMSGRIRLDGMLVGADLSLERYQSRLSAIFSDAYVFDHLLDDSGELADDQVVSELIKQLKLEDKASCRGGVLSTTKLSQGQRKRLALLASFVEDAQVCLYDELAAEQDPVFKRYFYTELLPELKRQGKVVIIISHDDQYFDVADQVIKFEEGKIVCRDKTATAVSLMEV